MMDTLPQTGTARTENAFRALIRVYGLVKRVMEPYFSRYGITANTFKKYEPEAYRVQYYKIEPHEKVGIIEVHCGPSRSRSSKVEVTYKYIGLSESGNRFIARFTKKDIASNVRNPNTAWAGAAFQS